MSCSQTEIQRTIWHSERGSHARGVYPTEDTSRMVTARVKQKEEADTREIARE